jgi:SAM-dependent methyltransferase
MHMPARLWHGARVLEFGPDSAENALVCARWGAHMTLVEPHAAAHPVIRNYFQQYGLYPWLEKIEQADIAEYAKRNVDPVFDMVIAEGFIYSIQPSSLWIDLFARLLRPGGMALISYYERYGGYIELFTKKIYNRVCELTGKPGLEVAHALFDAKWQTVQHTRSFAQWHADVLCNPFVDERFFLEAESLCQSFEAAGFRLYSSWPVYKNALDVFWHKLPERPGSRREFIEMQQMTWKYGDSFEDGNNCRDDLEKLLDAGDADAIIHFCQTDETWLKLYGMPNQFATFEKV